MDGAPEIEGARSGSRMPQADDAQCSRAGTGRRRVGRNSSSSITRYHPARSRNLENATGAQVLDRTGVIVEIFHRHARSREAKLQVEMARLKYVAPRLRESASRQRTPTRGRRGRKRPRPRSPQHSRSAGGAEGAAGSTCSATATSVALHAATSCASPSWDTPMPENPRSCAP